MKAILILAAVLLAGCSTSQNAYPHFIYGHYYMGGDANCVRFKQVSPTQIACANKNDQITGHRNAMTDQELAMYQHYQMQAQIAQQQMAAQIAANNQAMSNIQYPTMATPQVTPITPPGGNQIRCIGVGIYANCRY